MNTWLVGRAPIAHYIQRPRFEGEVEDETTLVKRGDKIFFLKGRIMAGQANLEGNTLGVKDFKWLTKHELKEVLPEDYFHSVRNMFAER